MNGASERYQMIPHFPFSIQNPSQTTARKTIFSKLSCLVYNWCLSIAFVISWRYHSEYSLGINIGAQQVTLPQHEKKQSSLMRDWRHTCLSLRWIFLWGYHVKSPQYTTRSDGRAYGIKSLCRYRMSCLRSQLALHRYNADSASSFCDYPIFLPRHHWCKVGSNLLPFPKWNPQPI